MTELIRIGILTILGSQASYFILLILLYGTMMHWYEWSTFPNPNNVFEKTVNFLTALVFGLAYWAGLKAKKQKWYIRSLHLIGYLIIYTIVAVITYKLLDLILNYIEMSFN